MFNVYVKDGKCIKATEFAYKAIYRQQGYKPVGDKVDIQGRGNTADNGAVNKSGKRRKSS